VNPWLRRRPLNIAHRGGAAEAPASTMFAMATAVAAGAHMLELDVHTTADGHVVVVHDETVDATTDGCGAVGALTLAQLQRLDAAYRFVPGVGDVADPAASDCPYRGVATGRRSPPAGFTADDFRVPLLADVLRRFGGVYVNIDLKRPPGDEGGDEAAVAQVIAAHGEVTNLMVASFHDAALCRFSALAPGVSTSAGPGETAALWQSVHDGSPAGIPGRHAVQVPVTYGDVVVVSEPFVRAAHDVGLAVHVWTVDEPAEMRRLLALGVDGIVTDRPSVLATVLAD